VVGASKDRAKYGNKVLRSLVDHGLEAFPVHPKEKEVEGIDVIQLEDVPDPKSCGISIVTPPVVTLATIQKASGLGFENFW